MRVGLLLLAVLSLPSNLHADDSWLRYGHDAALTGRSSLKGDIDGDGLAEIVVQDATGTVHCLDSSAMM